MATTEYIGARYVPKFFTNPTTGSTEWVDTVTYEPLTIATYNGYSYTSKRFVPVGIAITNTAYWALTGNFNGQVAVYVEQVAALADEVADLSDDVAAVPDQIAAAITQALTDYATKQYVDDAIAAIDIPTGLPADDRYLPGLAGKYVVAFGDSLIRGMDLPYADAWPAKITAAYGGGETRTLVSNKGFNGMSLATYSGSSNTAFDKLDQLFNDIDSTLAERGESVPYAIVLQGGANDFNHDVPIGGRGITNTDRSTFWGAMNELRRLIYTKYPKVRLMFMTTPNRKNARNNLGLTENDYGTAMLDFCRYNQIPCYDTQSDLGINITNPDGTFDWAVLSSNPTHYSAAAYDWMAPKIANWIINGSYSSAQANYISTVVNLSAPSGSSYRINQYREIRFPGGYKIISFRVDNLTVNPATQAGGMYYSDQIVIDLPNDTVIGNTPQVQVTATAFNETVTNFFAMEGVPNTDSDHHWIKGRIFSPSTGNRGVQLYITIFCNS